MTLEITTNFDLKKEADAIKESVRQGFGRLLQQAVTEMVLRIRSGRDVNNSPMHAYTPEYAKWKAKRGRRVGAPDMTFSGLMLNSIQSRVESSNNGIWTGEIYFSNPDAAARAVGNIENGRDFYGLTEKQKDALTNQLQGLIKI